MHAIRMIVFRNRFSLRIRIPCGRISLEICEVVLLVCCFSLYYADAKAIAVITVNIA